MTKDHIAAAAQSKDGRLMIGVVILIALALMTSLGIASMSIGTTGQVSTYSVSSPSLTGVPGESLPVPQTLVLYPLASVEKSIRSSVVVPSSTVMSADGSLSVVGALTTYGPPSGWSVAIYLWHGVFLNDSTTQQDIIGSGGVAIFETSTPAGVNSTAVAEEELTPPTPTLCQTTAGSSSAPGQTCVTESPPSSNSDSYIAKQNGLALIVSPSSHEISWVDSQRDVAVELLGPSTLTTTQLLALVNTMTLPP